MTASQSPSAFQADKESPWSSCNKKLIGKCKLWMVLASVFLSFILVIIISLCLTGVTYIDEDENEILDLSSNETFSVMLKIPEECVSEEELPDMVKKRLQCDSVDMFIVSGLPFSGENATIIFHLHFRVPPEDASFMKYVMSEEFVLGVLQQNFHDQNIAGCETLGLDPGSLCFYD
ncbi:hypothetical protein MJG53_020325, partial [Ovis ammon polii x Ovis aries]